MNLQAYANHRKALGLRGTSHVAVRDACIDGRLTPPAVRREGRSWIIDADLADEQWATRTDPSEKGAMGGGTARPIGITSATATTAGQPPAAAKGGPPLAISKQVKAAYDAKLTELDYKERSKELVLASETRAEAFASARAVRDALLSLADRLAPMLAATTDARECHRLLTEEHRIALRGLADG